MNGSLSYQSAGGIFRHIDGPFADGADPVAEALIAEAVGLGEEQPAVAPKSGDVSDAVRAAADWANEQAKPWYVRHWAWLAAGGAALVLGGLAVWDVRRRRAEG